MHRNNNGEKPTLVIDEMGVSEILNRNKVDMLYGGRHGEYYKKIDRLFRRLSDLANLVFFIDGPVVDEKHSIWLARKDSKYLEQLSIMDQVYAGSTIQDIVGKAKFISSATSHHRITTDRAKAYGTHIVAVTKDCDAEIAQYACNNKSVIAVLADDTDFLIFPGDWRYFSLAKDDGVQ